MKDEAHTFPFAAFPNLKKIPDSCWIVSGFSRRPNCWEFEPATLRTKPLIIWQRILNRMKSKTDVKVSALKHFRRQPRKFAEIYGDNIWIVTHPVVR